MHDLERYKPFQSFWLPVAYAAILGKVGRIEEAKGHLRRAEAQKPDFSSRAYGLFRRTLKVDPIIEDLMEGLGSAGMAIEGSRVPAGP